MSLTYAIGDVHGRRDLLERALDTVYRHSRGVSSRVVMLGDYVDRGPDSAGVIALLRRRQREWGVICVKGNHEAITVQAVVSGDTARWFRNGGEATLASYGGQIDPDDLAWMAGLPFFHQDHHRIFVHGGLSPGLSLAEQEEQTCLWIRHPFLKASADLLPAHVVHGHTPKWKGKPDPAAPELHEHRTNLDTAAFRTGRLTVGVFETEAAGGPVELLTILGPTTDLEI